MKYILSILIVLIIFLAVSCRYDNPVKDDGDNNNNGNPDPDTSTVNQDYHNFHPMRVGSVREFEFNDKSEKVILRVVSQDILGIDTIFNMNTLVKYSKRIDGLYLKHPDKDSFRLIYKYPAVLNEEYDFDDSRVIIKNIDTLIKVPFGEFNCIQYFFESKKSGGINVNYFITKNIGLIKSDFLNSNRDLELINFKY